MLYYEKLNKFLQILEKQIINNNGIIYDIYACSSLLALYNKKCYFNKQLPIENFYDISYDIQTIDRIITITNIKITFKQCIDHINFYTFINENANIINELKISFDITISNDEPPFKSNNYICYGLLLTKDENNKPKYYYSRNTGTPYDYHDNVGKKIINDILNKKTQYIRGFHTNYEIFTNIYKMINNGWIINNLPYKISSIISSDNCPICLNRFKENKDEILTLYKDIFSYQSPQYQIHHKCLIKFFNIQKNSIYFKCPYRYIIDFNICKYLIDYNN